MKKNYFCKDWAKHTQDPNTLDLVSKWSTITTQRKKFHDNWKMVKNYGKKLWLKIKRYRYDFTGNSKVIVKTEKKGKRKRVKGKLFVGSILETDIHFSGIFTGNKKMTVKER